MLHIPLKISVIRTPLIRVLANILKLTPEDAGVTVDHLIRSEQYGKSGHGLIRISYLLQSGQFGPYGNHPAPEPRRVAPGHIRVNGAGHLGYPVLYKLMRVGCDEAKKNRVSVATCASVYPSGSLGDWARVVCEEGVGLLIVAGSPPRVAPPGGTHPVLGTNAVCIGIPAHPLPLISDSATSEITHGVLLLRRQSKQPLPPDSAVGPDGQPTCDPTQVDPVRGQGALLPFGKSHKAFALAMGIELLASLGGNVPGRAAVGEHGLFCVFLGPEVLADSHSTVSQWLQALDEAGTRIPGWVSGRLKKDQQNKAIVRVPQETFKALSVLLPPGIADHAAVANENTPGVIHE